MRTKTILVLLITMVFQIGFSQDKTPWLSFGGGITNLSSSTKTTALDNGYNIQADAFFPFYKKIFSENNYFLLGINVGANYTNLKNSEPDNVAVSNKYQVYSTTNTVSSASTGSSSSNLGGLLGLQATFGINKFYVSPLLSTGYSNLTLQGYSQTATYTANGQSKQKELVQREKQNLSGFMMKPQLRVGYHLSPSLSLFTNVAYTFGPKINTTTNIWVPQGGFNSSNQYEPPQIQNGSWLATNTSSDYKTLDINFGITVHMNAGKLKGKVIKPGDNGLVKRIDNGGDSPSEEKIVTHGSDKSINEKGIKRGESAIVAPTTDKSINEKGIKRGESAIVAPTTDKSINEKGIKRGESAIVAPTTDKSINEKGIKRSESAIVAPTTGKSISEKGVKRSESVIVAPSSDKSINEKGIKRTDTSVMAVSGQPIGGIIVKGGKNPGGNLINAVTNEKGEVSFTITEVGEYTLKITTPEVSGKSISEKGVKRSESAIVAPSSDKSINEKGIKRTDTSVMAVSGQPIGGIIVKGGKNPGGGNAINAVTDKNGEVTFTVSETGEYTLQVLNSTNSTIKGVAPAAIKLLK